MLMTDKAPARRVLLCAEHVLDARPHLALPVVRLCLRVAQRAIASSALVDTAPEAPRLQFALRLGRAVGAVGVHLVRGVALVQEIVERLAVVHARIANPVLANQLVPGIGVHMVLVAKEAAPMLLRPTRVLVFLPVLRRMLLPVLRSGAGLDLLVLLAAVTLARHRHDRGVDHLTAAHDVALGFEILAEPIEQLVDQTCLGQLLAEQPEEPALSLPKGGAIRNAALEAWPEKARERQSVPHLVLDLLIRQIVQRLQDQHTKQHQRVDRLAPGVAFPGLVRRQHHGLDVGAKLLPRHQRTDRNQRIALRRQHRQTLVRIEKPHLRHSKLPQTNHIWRKTRTHQTPMLFFEVPLYNFAVVAKGLPDDLVYAIVKAIY